MSSWSRTAEAAILRIISSWRSVRVASRLRTRRSRLSLSEVSGVRSSCETMRRKLVFMALARSA